MPCYDEARRDNRLGFVKNDKQKGRNDKALGSLTRQKGSVS